MNEYLQGMKALGRCAKLSTLFVGLLCVAACSRQSPPPERTFPVSVGEVTEQDAPLFIEVIGNVYSLQTVQVRPQVGGIVTEAYVKQGQYVKKGDKLYQIDPRPYEASLAQAKGTLEKDKAAREIAKVTLARNAELVKQDYVSKLTSEQYKANVESAQGQIVSDEGNVKLAELNLEWSTIVSPIDGKISAYNIDPGNLVTANDTVFLTDIRQITPIDIRFNINQKDFLRVQEAKKEGSLKFYVILPQQPDKPREGTIYFVDNHVDTTTGTLLLKGTVLNEDEFLWPGEFVHVRLQLKVVPNALVVPMEAVQNGQDGPYVFVYLPATSTVEYRRVTKGPKIDKMVLVEQGVANGEKVVTKGQLNLRPGSKVYLPDADKTSMKPVQ